MAVSLERISNYLTRFIEGSRSRGIIPQLRYSIATEANKIKFKNLNNGLSVNQIAVAPGVILQTHPDAYYAFRYFTDLDAEMVEEMQSFIKMTQGKVCLLDIGAHYGIFSLVFGSRQNSVAFALEPSPPAYEKLIYHHKLNSECNVIPLQLGMGAIDGKLEMRYDGNHLVALPTKNLGGETTANVDIVTLDNFTQQQDILPDVIKIDTEGFELNVLKGGKQFLAHHSPTIFLEVHPTFLSEMGYSVNGLVDFLLSLNYRFYNSRMKLIQKPEKFLSKSIRRVICTKGNPF